MAHLHLVTGEEPRPRERTGEPAAFVPLRLLMAASGRCDCDDCCRAYLAGDRTAGRVDVGARRRPASGR